MDIQTILNISPLRSGARFKCSRMGAAAINTAGNLTVAGVDNAANARIQKGINRSNERIAREANAAQAQLQQEQNDWNYNLWKENNEYNSPAAQRERLVEAGYNPLMADGAGFSGNSSQPAQGVDPMPQNVATLNAPDFDLSALVDLGEKMSLIRKTDAETKGQEIQNDWDPKLFASELAMKMTAANKLNLEIQDLQNALPWNSKKREQDWFIGESIRKKEALNAEFIEKTMQDRLDQMRWMTKISERQWTDFEKRWRLIDSQVRNMDAQTLVAEAQRLKLIAETVTIDALRDDQVEELRERIIAMRLNSASRVLDVPTNHRAAFLSTLNSFGFDSIKELKSGLRKVNWYREPNDIVKAFMVAADIITADNHSERVAQYLKQFQVASEHFDSDEIYGEEDVQSSDDSFAHQSERPMPE